MSPATSMRFFSGLARQRAQGLGGTCRSVAIANRVTEAHRKNRDSCFIVENRTIQPEPIAQALPLASFQAIPVSWTFFPGA